MQTWYMSTPQKALNIESFFSGTVSENLDIYGIMQVSVHVDANNSETSEHS